MQYISTIISIFKTVSQLVCETVKFRQRQQMCYVAYFCDKKSVLSILVKLIIDETFSSAPLTIDVAFAFFHRKIQIADWGGLRHHHHYHVWLMVFSRFFSHHYHLSLQGVQPSNYFGKQQPCCQLGRSWV